MPSYAGNSLGTATYLSIDASLKSFTDHVDTIQADGYYRFNFSTSSSLNLVINGLSANADVSLLNSSGGVIQSSSNTGLLAESINTTLQSGTYYIKVSGVSSADTDYNLSVQTSFSTDLLLHDSSTGLNHIWGLGGTNRTAVISGGTITDAGGNPLALPSSFSIQAVTDFNQDNIPDLLLHDSSTGLNYIWGLGGANGTAVVSGGTITDAGGNPLALPSSFSIQAVTDFNQDGTPDLLLHDSSNGRYYIWGLGGANHTAVVSGGTITDAGGNPLALPNSFSIPAVTDFNQDGIPDLLLHDSSNGRYYIWGLGGANGTAVISGGTITDAGGNPLALPDSFSIPAVADFNQDGIPDLLLHDSSNGLNYIWGLGGANGTAVVSGGTITDAGGNPLALPSSFSIQAVTDFTQDGIPDLLLHDSSNGRYYIWGLGGANHTAVVSGGTITDAGGNPLALPSSFSIPAIVSRALPIDVAGDDTSTAFDVGTLNGTGIYKDTVDDIDYSDFYKFTTASTAKYSLLLDGLTGNADFELLNSSGTLIQSSANAGTAPEQIIRLLAAGTYYLHVYTLSGSAKYNLHLSNSTIDLQGASFSTPASIIAGQSFDANFQVQNTGITASGGFTVSFYLSTDNTIDTSDQLLGSYNAASLAGGATSANLIKNLTLPATSNPFWNNNPGTYYIGMIVDSQGTVNEISENNNSNVGFNLDYTSANVSLTDIDLVGVTSGFNLKTLSNTPLTSGFAGQQFNANFKIQNAGSTDTNAAFTVSFYISKDSQIDASDKLLGTYDISDYSSLVAGGNTGSQPLTKNLTLPPIGDPFWNGVLTDDYYIGMLIDSNNTVFETTETNNSSVAVDTDYVKAKISQNAVDLVGDTFQDGVSGFAVTDQNLATSSVVDVTAGAAFDFSFSLKNIGNTAANPFKVAFYISTDNKYDAGTDKLLTASSDPNTTYYYDISSLGAGASTGLLYLDQAHSNRLILPGVADDFWSQGNGTYYIGMVIDPNLDNPDTDGIVGDIDEVDELNNYSRDVANTFTDLGSNYAAVNVTGVSGIDLKGKSFDIGGVSSASAGTGLTATYKIENSGVTDIASSFRVGFYLSSDATITTNDTFLGSSIISSLGAKQVSSSLTKSLTIPSGLTAGTYYLGMFVDSLNANTGGQVAETNDSNRTSGGVWTVGNNSSVGDGIDFKSITIS